MRFKAAIASGMVVALAMCASAVYVDANNVQYEPLDYLQASGSQWIVTDITPTCTDRVKMKFRLTETGTTQSLYCSRTDYTVDTFTAFYIDNIVRCDRNTNPGASSEVTPTATEDCTLDADYETCRFSVNGTLQSATMAAGSYTPGSVLMLFASHKLGNGLTADVAASDVINRGSYRLFYFELYASGSETPKHRLVPVVRMSDCAAGMFDTVTGKFYGVGSNSGAFSVDCTIRNVTAKPRYPWNGLVDLRFTIIGEAGKTYDTSFTAKDMVGNTNIAMRTIRKADGTAASATEQLLPGTYSWVWDTVADLPKGFKCNRVRVAGTALYEFPYSVKFNANGGTGTMANESFTYGTAKALTANAFTREGYTFQGWATSASGAKVYNDKQSVLNLTTTSGAVVNLYAVWKSALYMVVDLSSGSSSTSYPVSYLDAVPSGGWSDTYKTTKLVLRRCEAGTFKMQNSSNVTLTKPFYIGVFEVTQRQYKQVMGGDHNGSGPMSSINYSTIRGSSGWPSSSSVGSTSILGKLRSRTGLSFDLPTEAQWEYACRAGTTTTYYWGNSINGNYAWYDGNANSQIHSVGLKKPNAWGLYDMGGNLQEWCLDWYNTLTYGTDPKGKSSPSAEPWDGRVLRGGAWNGSSTTVSSSYRTCLNPSSTRSSDGFRLCLTLSN